MDNRRRIPVKDVRQIAYEVGMWAIDIERLNALSKKMGKPSDIEFKEKFNGWIEDRIQMVIDRLDGV
jgi:predicted DNA-binding protein